MKPQILDIYLNEHGVNIFYLGYISTYYYDETIGKRIFTGYFDSAQKTMEDRKNYIINRFDNVFERSYSFLDPCDIIANIKEFSDIEREELILKRL